ncbi:MAG: TetR/AcrR family transcriptional regulator [Chloroflexota bacterium]
MLEEIYSQANLKKRGKRAKMHHIKNDKRSIRSAEMLYDGLAKLMVKMPFDDIRVKDLVEAAGVGRNTFHRNFDDIVDILWLRCDLVFEGLIQYLIEYTQKHDDTSPNMLKPVLRYFYLNSDIIELLMTAKRLDIIQSSFLQAVEPYKMRALAFFNDDEEDYVNYSLIIRIGIITNILVHWIDTGKKRTPDELADKLNQMYGNLITFDQVM